MTSRAARPPWVFLGGEPREPREPERFVHGATVLRGHDATLPPWRLPNRPPPCLLRYGLTSSLHPSPTCTYLVTTSQYIHTYVIVPKVPTKVTSLPAIWVPSILPMYIQLTGAYRHTAAWCSVLQVHYIPSFRGQPLPSKLTG